jgi:hypothetical protein
MSSLFRNVQRPPETPNHNPESAAAKPNEVLLQSPWVTRETTVVEKPEATSRYSVQELIDILCGDGPAVPEIQDNITRTTSILKAFNKNSEED